MAPEDQGDRTEAPTQRRRDEAHQQGQVARSVDLSSTVALLGAIIALNFLGGKMFNQLGTLMMRLLDVRDGSAWDLADVGRTLGMCLWSLASVLLPLLLTIMAPTE